MMIGLFYNVLIGPLVILGVVDVEWFVILFRRIIIIAELESVVIISTVFLDT